MKRSFYLKFLLTYLVFGLLSFLISALAASPMTKRYLFREQANNLYSEATLIATAYSDQNKAGLSEELINEQMKAVAAFLRVDIWLVDRKGRIISDSDSEKQKDQQIPDFDEAIPGGRRWTIGNYRGMFSEEVLSVAAPITREYFTGGYVLIHLPSRELRRSESEILAIIYRTSLILFLLSLLILLVFYFIVFRPLRSITTGAMKYAAGDYAYRIEVKSRDEMGYLAETLNFMSEEIGKADEYQRQFIANVSHDFRSPLTSIKGYLEAILDGTIPPEMERKYLQRLIVETERLEKLTGSLLSLNSVEQKGFLIRSSFDVNQVIKSVCESFEMSCQKKRITFELTFSEKREPVYADHARIQQVLYNLIDNALKFSGENSVIGIRSGLRGTKVFVSVKDSGIGIPKKDLTKIWDRFYKTDLSRGRDKQGTGLGLSIVKSIIHAHGENIDCVSTEGVGTEFTFTLTAADHEDGES